MRAAGATSLAGFGRASMRPGVANQAQRVQASRALMCKRVARVLRAFQRALAALDREAEAA